jgi:hypothetical protein
MPRTTGAQRPDRRAARAVMAISALIAMAGCGSTAGGSAPGRGAASSSVVTASTGVPLCVHAHHLDRVTLRLTVTRAREILPRVMTISAAPQVQALAAALCGLPRLPRGLHCPAALSGALRLEFTAAGQAYPPLRIQDSGCANVTGMGPLRQWSWSSRPGQLLSAAAGGKGRLVPGTHPSSVPTQ